jgi:hypothetical protein
MFRNPRLLFSATILFGVATVVSTAALAKEQPIAHSEANPPVPAPHPTITPTHDPGLPPLTTDTSGKPSK